MALLFGRLTQDFVNFQMVLGRAKAGDADSSAKIPQAAVDFRHGASLNAIYLVVLGS
jgi:ATP-binding cassette subfamily B (MDR/TAP) protein 1